MQSPAPLWESLKATLRGYIISFSQRKKRRQQQECSDLESRAMELEAKCLTLEDPELISDSAHTQSMIKQLYTDEAWQAWSATHSRIYQWGNKSTKTLHWLCTRAQDPLLASTIISDQGTRALTNAQRADAFRKY